MADLLATLSFGCSFIAATISLIEWFLSEQQKQWVDNVAIGAWSKLDDLKQQRVRLDLRASTPQWVLGIMSLSFSVLIMSTFSPYADTRTTEPIAFWTFIASLIVAIILVMKWMLPTLQDYFSNNRYTENYAWTIFRLWFGMVIFYGVWIFVFAGAFIYETGISRLIGIFLDVTITTGRNTVMALIYLIIITRITFLVRPPLIAGEIVTRRIAESKQGSLLAVAGLASVIGSFLKLFVAD